MDKKNDLYKEALLKSAEIDEIISQPPHWLIRWGITGFLGVLIMVLALSYFIEYPEIVSVPITLQPNNPAIAIKVNGNGQLIGFTKKVGQQVLKSDTLLLWKQSNTNTLQAILSPVNGKMEFVSPILSGEVLSKGQPLIFVVPQATAYFASAYVSAAAINKIKTGQKAVLDIAQYPHQQFGYLNGVIAYKSSVGTTNGFYITISLTNGLKSDIGKFLSINNGAKGTTDIVLSKQKLLYKLLGKYKI